VRTAQKLVPEIQAMDDAPEGESEIHWPNPEQLLAHFQGEKQAGRKPAGLVVCRLNAPCISICLKLMGLGVAARLMKGDVLAQLRQLIDQLSERDNGLSIAELLSRANAWASERLAKLSTQRNSDSRMAIVTDKLACVQALADADDVRTAGDLQARIRTLYPDDERQEGPDGMVVLSTVHGAKGREANTVYILSPIPKKGNGSVFDQVWESATDRNNTLYVAVTRARLRLVFVGPMPTLARLRDEDKDADADYEETAEACELAGGSDGQARTLFGD
jgi:hypothetical protein